MGTGEHPRGTHRLITQPEWVAELTDAQRAVLEPAYVLNRPMIANDGVRVATAFRDPRDRGTHAAKANQ